MKNNKSDEELIFPPEIVKLIKDPSLFGKMNDPTSSAYLKGPCGDYMEFYLVIENSRIINIKYYTEGCASTRACAAMAASLALQKTVKDALNISAGQIIGRLKGLSEDHLHCAILAVSTLYRALADYLLKP